jgi:hypothetical protein
VGQGGMVTYLIYDNLSYDEPFPALHLYPGWGPSPPRALQTCIASQPRRPRRSHLPTQLPSHLHAFLPCTPTTTRLYTGKAIAGQRDKYVIATKCGIVFRDGQMAYDGSRAHVRAACEASLKRLGTSVIDLYYLHRVDPATPVSETFEEMKVRGGCQGMCIVGKTVRATLGKIRIQTNAQAGMSNGCTYHPVRCLSPLPNPPHLSLHPAPSPRRWWLRARCAMWVSVRPPP